MAWMADPTRRIIIIRVSVSVIVTVTPLHVVVLTTLSLLCVILLLLIILSYTLYVDNTVAIWLAAVTLEVTECDACIFCYCLVFLLLAAAEPFVLDCV